VRISFADGANVDLEESAAFYSRSSPETTLRFLDAVSAAIDKISRDPARYLSLGKNEKACSVVGFPFQVVYRFTSNEPFIYVLAVAHAKRHPGCWNERT
jgi:plasmid stabilization system protein ParE